MSLYQRLKPKKRGTVQRDRNKNNLVHNLCVSETWYISNNSFSRRKTTMSTTMQINSNPNKTTVTGYITMKEWRQKLKSTHSFMSKDAFTTLPIDDNVQYMRVVRLVLTKRSHNTEIALGRGWKLHHRTYDLMKQQVTVFSPALYPHN